MSARGKGGPVADPQPAGRVKSGAVRGDPAAARRDYLWTACVFLGAFAFYLKSAAPDFLFDDNSEFIASSYYLGITHSPGYPIASLIGKLFTHLAPGTAGFTVNMQASFFAGAAVALGFLLLLRAAGWWAPALLGAAMMAAARLFWEQAGQADVYALNGFFLFLTLNIAWGLDGGRRDKIRLTALSSIFIFALFNHYTMILVFPVYVVYIFWLYRGRFPALLRIVPPVVFGAAVWFSVMMYLPLRSASGPVINWDDQTRIGDFVQHVKGVDLRRETPRVPLGDKWRFVKDYGMRLWRERTPFLLPLLPLGFWALGSRGRPFGRRGWLLIGIWFALFAGYIMLPNYLYGPRSSYALKNFHCTSLLLLACFMGLGADVLLRAVRGARLPWGAVFAIVAVLTAYSALACRDTADHSNDMIAPLYARNMLINTPRDGVLFSTIETESFPLMNFRAVRFMRRDITLIGRHGDPIAAAFSIGNTPRPDVRISQTADVEKYALLRTLYQRPLLFTSRLDFQERPGLYVVTNGLLYQLATEGQRLDRPDPWNRIDMSGINYNFKEYNSIQRSVLSRYLMLHGEHHLEIAHLSQALEYFSKAEKFNPGSRLLRANLGGIFLRINDLQRAREEYEAGLRDDPENVETSIDTVAMYSNLSFIYGSFGEDAKALDSMKTAVRLDPKNGLLHVNLGKTYWHQDNCLSAVEELDKAVRLGFDDAGVFDVLGICYEKLHFYKEAEKNYERALESNPSLPDTYRDYGIFDAYSMNRPERAVELLNTYLELAPGVADEPQIRANIGFLNQMTGKYEAAVAAFKTALLLGADKTPRQSAVINDALAVCLDKAGHTDDAAKAFEKGLPGADSYPSIYVNYADFLDRQKKTPDRAMRLLDKYLAAVPNPKDRIRVDLIMSSLKAKLKK